MSELSAFGRIKKVLQTAKTLHCGVSELAYKDVIELVGNLESLEEDANLLRVELASRDADLAKMKIYIGKLEKHIPENNLTATRLALALDELLKACELADSNGELSDFVDGSLLDKARNVLQGTESVGTQLSEANSLLRSAYQIAERKGTDTNWEAFVNNLRKELLRQAGHSNLKTDKQLILRATCTAMCYKMYPDEEE